jgi:anti-sigma B factor antagonist
MDLGLEVGEQDGVTIVTARGDLDLASAPRLREAAVARLMAGDKVLVIDLTDLEFLDSTGLGTLVAVLKRARSLDATLALVIGHDRVRRVFELTALTTAFAIHDTLDDALAGAKQRP